MSIEMYENYTAGLDSPAVGAVEITPDDDADLPILTRGLYVGTSGSVKMTMKNGSVVTRQSVAAGVTHPWRVKRVWATGTTATDVVGDY